MKSISRREECNEPGKDRADVFRSRITYVKGIIVHKISTLVQISLFEVRFDLSRKRIL